MPELPEVERHRKEISSLLKKQPRLEKVICYRGDIRFPLDLATLSIFEGQKLLRIDRRAKYLLFKFEKGQILNSLGMTGYWRNSSTQKKHDHLELLFDNGVRLLFNDARRFGFVESKNPEIFLQDLGPEPLDSDWNGQALSKALQGRTSPIKPLLMNAQIVVGIGNIYASEALYRAKISPKKMGQKLSEIQCQRLVSEVKALLRIAIASGGSTIRSYKGVDGKPGDFQKLLQVYGRDQTPCTICGTPIRKIVQTGRSTFFCPSCQR